MYRSVFLLVMMIFLVAINTCGWRSAGVNHVLIFELNPRTHLTFQQVMEVGHDFEVFQWTYRDSTYVLSFFLSIVVSLFISNMVPESSCLYISQRYWHIPLHSSIDNGNYHIGIYFKPVQMRLLRCEVVALKDSGM